MMLLLILGLLAGANAAPDLDGWEYVSPKPGSIENSRKSTIILRPGPEIAPPSIDAKLVQVTGSVSGEIPGRLVLSTDGRTIIFTPDQLLATGETVAVVVADGLTSTTGSSVDGIRFEFSVTGFAEWPNPYAWMPGLRPERRSSSLAKSANDSTPPAFPVMEVEMIDSTALGEGYIFMAVASDVDSVGYYLMMLNNDGSPFFARELENDYAYDFKLQPNGRLSYAHFFEHHSYTGGGNVVHKILDDRFVFVDSVQMGNGYVAEAHDFQILPNGHYLLFGYYLTPVDMSRIVEGGRPDALVSGGVVQELDVEKNVIFQWRSWDYHAFDEWEFSPRQRTRAIVSEFHLNTINLDDDGHILLSTPSMTKKINRQTGEVMWTLGSHENEFSFVNTDTTEGITLATGHTFHRLPSGNVLVHDNGSRRGTRSSRVNEFVMDEEARTLELVWTYEPDTLIAGWHRGSAQRLPNGNTVIGWGGSSGKPSPAMTEVDADGRKLMEITFDPPAIESYRAFRFPFTAGAPSAEVVVTEVAPGNEYEFSEGDTVSTGVAIEVTNLGDTGYNELTVRRYDHAPLAPEFPGKAPRLQPRRMVLDQFGLTSIETNVLFDVDSWKIGDPANTIVYHREFEGQGLLIPLETTYNPVKRELKAAANSIGEFVLATPDFEAVVFVPSPVSPADSGTVNQSLPITFEWAPVGYVNTYHFQVATDEGFADLVIDEERTTAAVYTTEALADDTRYYWRVRATNGAGTSNWTATQTFETVEPYISLTSPVGGEELVQGLDYYIRWEDNLEEDVVIELHQFDALLDTIAVTSSDGAYEWEVGVELESGPEYWVKIYSTADGSIVDSNAESFSIVVATAIEDQEAAEIPERVALRPAYPNPFRASTTIEFSVASAQPVTLQLYDASGRLVRTLFSATVPANSRQQVRIDGSELAAGAYLVRLTGRGAETSARVVVVR